jgi:hypothetical protein
MASGLRIEIGLSRLPSPKECPPFHRDGDPATDGSKKSNGKA